MPLDEPDGRAAEHEVFTAGAYHHAVVEPHRIGAGVVALIPADLLAVADRCAFECRRMNKPVGFGLRSWTETDADPTESFVHERTADRLSHADAVGAVGSMDVPLARLAVEFV